MLYQIGGFSCVPAETDEVTGRVRFNELPAGEDPQDYRPQLATVEQLRGGIHTSHVLVKLGREGQEMEW